MTGSTDIATGTQPVNPPPTGSVTFLFTDIQGSTKLWERFPDTMAVNLARHDALMRQAIVENKGYVFKTIGDAFCAAFPTASDGLQAALDAQRALNAENWGVTGPIRVRMALNTGEPECRDNDYFGPPVNRVARLLSTGHGGQVLLSPTAEASLDVGRLPENISLRSLGEYRLKDIAHQEPIYQLVAPDLPQVFPKLKMPSRAYRGVIASVVAPITSIFLYQYITSGFSTSVFTKPSFLDNIKGTILDLSTRNELALIGLATLVLLVLIGAVWVRQRSTQFRPGKPAPAAVQFSGQFVTIGSLSFLAGTLLVLLIAFGYQQYLWRIELPIPDDAVGIALTREAAAASISEELEDALFVQGDNDQIVVRELPVSFDAGDIDTAREMGDRIGARAVVIYRAEERDDETEYVAYVVFTDPSVGVRVGTTPASAEDSATVVQSGGFAVQPSIGVPQLRTTALTQLVNATAGILAHEEGRYRDAIRLLDEARAGDPEGQDLGLIDYYLGSAFWYVDSLDESRAAYERAVAHYETRMEAGRLPAQGELVLAWSYLDLGRLHASLFGGQDAAMENFDKAIRLREDLLVRKDQLERPSDVHATFAQIYALIADIHRGRGEEDEQGHWERRALEEANLVSQDADPSDDNVAILEGVARARAGDCTGALAALDRVLAENPEHLDALTLSAILHLLEGRPDLANADLDRAIAARPDAIVARDMRALVSLVQAIGEDDFFEPAYIIAAEDAYRELVQIDRSNVNAHWWLAELARMRSDAERVDSTALLASDEINVTKSQTLWARDPARRQAAIDALGDAIEEFRIVAYELDLDNIAVRLRLAAMYELRMELTYFGMQPLAEAGDEAALEQSGRQIADDMARLREATDAIADDGSEATRLQQLEALGYRAAGAQYEWSRLYFYETDPEDGDSTDDERAAAAEQEWRDAAVRAIAYAEAGPLGTPDEQVAASLGYAEQWFITLLLDEDQAAAQTAFERYVALQTEAQQQWAAGGDQATTICHADREVMAAEEQLAAGNIAGAAERYQAALELAPGHAIALAGLAQTQYLQGDAGAALVTVGQATDAYADNAEAWSRRGLYALVIDDAVQRNEAYDRFLALAAGRPPQERLALVNRAVADLALLIESDPQHASHVLDVLPRFWTFLDGIDDAEDTYQYPRLYSDLARLLLLADDAARAEELLRRSLTLDDRQPLAELRLALTLRVQDRDASAELAAFVEEINDPLWEESANFDSFGRSELLDLAEAEITAYLAAHPDHTDAVAPLSEAIEGEKS